MDRYQNLLNELIDIQEHNAILHEMQLDLIEMKANLNILKRRVQECKGK